MNSLRKISYIGIPLTAIGIILGILAYTVFGTTTNYGGGNIHVTPDFMMTLGAYYAVMGGVSIILIFQLVGLAQQKKKHRAKEQLGILKARLKRGEISELDYKQSKVAIKSGRGLVISTTKSTSPHIQENLKFQAFCKNCGAEIYSGERFCEKCGNEILFIQQ